MSEAKTVVIIIPGVFDALMPGDEAGFTGKNGVVYKGKVVRVIVKADQTLIDIEPIDCIAGKLSAATVDIEPRVEITPGKINAWFCKLEHLIVVVADQECDLCGEHVCRSHIHQNQVTGVRFCQTCKGKYYVEIKGGLDTAADPLQGARKRKVSNGTLTRTLCTCCGQKVAQVWDSNGDRWKILEHFPPGKAASKCSMSNGTVTPSGCQIPDGS